MKLRPAKRRSTLLAPLSEELYHRKLILETKEIKEEDEKEEPEKEEQDHFLVHYFRAVTLLLHYQ
jgi:hypothetical protein